MRLPINGTLKQFSPLPIFNVRSFWYQNSVRHSSPSPPPTPHPPSTSGDLGLCQYLFGDNPVTSSETTRCETSFKASPTNQANLTWTGIGGRLPQHLLTPQSGRQRSRGVGRGVRHHTHHHFFVHRGPGVVVPGRKRLLGVVTGPRRCNNTERRRAEQGYVKFAPPLPPPLHATRMRDS